MIEILDRYAAAVLYRSETSTTFGDAAKEAIRSRADLRGAYLGGADLRGADLRGAYLSGAELSYADLRGAELSYADLRGADLSGADLRGADLRGADLSRAYLSGAQLPEGMTVLQVLGSREAVVAIHTGSDTEVRIGCQHKPLEWWLSDPSAEATARLNAYTDAQITEYRMHLDYVAQWAKVSSPSL